MLEDSFGHTPADRALERGDVYGIGFDERRAARSPVRLGIIGAGGVAQSKWLPAIARLRTIWEPIRVVGVADPDRRQAQKAAAIHCVRPYPDAASLLVGEALDGVLVLSPDELHAEHAGRALEAGCHVLVEKPITRSLSDSAALCERAHHLGRILMAVANLRYAPPHRRARELLDSGTVARPNLLTGKFNLGYDYVDLLESGTIHVVDLARFYLGDVTRVQALASSAHGHSRHRYPFDSAVISLQFDGGAIGSITTSASALSFKPWTRIEIYGDRRWLAVEDNSELVLHESEQGPTKSWRPVFAHTLCLDEEFGGYMGMIENFVQAIRGEDCPLVTGWDGHKAYELTVAAHLSLARSSAVDLPLDPRSADAELGEWRRARGWRGPRR